MGLTTYLYRGYNYNPFTKYQDHRHPSTDVAIFILFTSGFFWNSEVFFCERLQIFWHFLVKDLENLTPRSIKKNPLLSPLFVGFSYIF